MASIKITDKDVTYNFKYSLEVEKTEDKISHIRADIELLESLWQKHILIPERPIKIELFDPIPGKPFRTYTLTVGEPVDDFKWSRK